MLDTSPLSPALACAIECTGKFNLIINITS
jgi:hypothetical protein